MSWPYGEQGSIAFVSCSLCKVFLQSRPEVKNREPRSPLPFIVFGQNA